ncbi:LacI family DNA-binding transcriptional regulator [Chengkuizengella axinellae]|uniref:LacI family DNA-binding transcriptional regulator n=1 Tax=Chengkuizengella axinellae TaxID=3064388 RepID=A0ABT9IUK4_9BACL|nr:LacI family DNA-binding transcriptional regulator [Chengkuizengella sp. 2205SS18-9]MDP5273039.1 LacI family DNA-binding transcriptional regulator [Chengkuizengella sp. 2205SS18-9]
MATIRDISKLAGVSVTTVSRALNHYDDVSPTTKQKIIEIAKEIGYVPNRSAQNLVKNQNNTLAIILSGLEKNGGKDNIIYRLLSGMYSYSESVNYEVVLYTTSSAHQREKTYVQFCREHNIGGAVLNGIRLDDPYFKELVNSDLPCVLIDIPAIGGNTSSISIHNKQAANDAVSYLIEQNHKHIGMINGHGEASVSLERYEGYVMALNKYKIEINEQYIVHADFQQNVAYEKTKQLLNKCPEITALFCASDMMALGAMKAMKEMNLKIPDDISVIGFDDIPLAEFATPPLTTMEQDFYRMGEEAARQLLKMIKHEKTERNIFLEHNLIVRNSVRML